ncbi:MAG: hypothetical protein R2769_05035 [Saprospiraceae bacterium]
MTISENGQDAIGYMVEKDTLLRRTWQGLDFGLAIARGMIADRVVSVKDEKLILDFSVINDYDYYEWICMHGADPKYMRDYPTLKSMKTGLLRFSEEMCKLQMLKQEQP